MRLATWPVLVLFSAPLFMHAQDKPTPPAEVDQALRERATQYMQFMIDHAFSKAYPLVADESKDWFLSSGKPQYTKFKVQDIEFSPGFQQAVVKTAVTRIFSMQGHDTLSDVVVSDIWKLQDGKWMYYHDPDVFSTPFGDVKIDRKAPSHVDDVPTDVGPEATSKRVAGLKLEVSSNKSEIDFVQGTAGDDEIVIHNGLIGQVDIESDIVGDYGSFAVQPARLSMGAGKDVVLKVSYKPVDRQIESNLRVRVQPFGRVMMVPIRVTASGSAPAAAASH